MSAATDLMNYALTGAFIVVGLCQLMAMVRVVLSPLVLWAE